MEIGRRVRIRMVRRSLLIQDEPIDLWMVLDEAVTLRILPCDVGTHAGLDETFAILEFSIIRSTVLTTEESTVMIEMLVEEPLWKLRPRVSGST